MPSFGRHPRDGTYLFAGGPAMDESDIIYENGVFRFSQGRRLASASRLPRTPIWQSGWSTTGDDVSSHATVSTGSCFASDQAMRRPSSRRHRLLVRPKCDRRRPPSDRRCPRSCAPSVTGTPFLTSTTNGFFWLHAAHIEDVSSSAIEVFLFASA